MLTEIEEILRPRIIVCVAGAYPGQRAHSLVLTTARDVIAITGSRACIIHVPRAPDEFPSCGIPLADFVQAFKSPLDVVPLINTSRAASAAEALRMIDSGLRFFKDDDTFRRAPLVKLEILDRTLATVPSEVLGCLADMGPELRARTIPYVPPDPNVVTRARELGCPAIRIAAGAIGRRTGILNLDAVRTSVKAAGKVPCILEGGLDSGRDVQMCANIGAEAVLINSAFALAEDATQKARELRAAADLAWGGLRVGDRF
jgi:thiazole synthase ThiGH ThiG subunit